MVKRSEILIAARAIVADPERWTQGHLAEGPDGDLRNPRENDACKFCAFGAALRAAHELGGGEREGHLAGKTLDISASHFLPRTHRREGLRPIAYLNDRLGDESRELVLKAYDLAIESARLAELGEIDA